MGDKTKTSPEATSPHNKNPNGPDEKYNKVEQALYDLNFKVGTSVPVAQKSTEFYLDNLGGRFVTVDASADGVYDAGVQNRKVEAAKSKGPSK